MGEKSQINIRIPVPSRLSLRLLVVVAVLTTVIAAAWLVLNRPVSPPFSEQAKSSGLTLYYPSRPLAGYRYGQTAYDPEIKVVSYELVNGERKLLFTLQPKNSDFNFTKFHREQITASRTLKTPNGEAVIGTLTPATVSSVLADRTWILITASGPVPIGDLEETSRRLVKY